MSFILSGHTIFQTLSTAVRFDLFTLLSRHGSLTDSEIARRLQIQMKPARILLLGCAALKLIKKKGDTYSNTTFSARLFSTDSPLNIISIVLWQHFIVYGPTKYFYDSVRDNTNVGLKELPGDEPTVYERLAHAPELENIFQDAMTTLSSYPFHSLLRAIDFSNVRHVVDIGGGTGANMFRLLWEFPHLKGTVYDIPSVAASAEAHIAREEMSSRVQVISGNCFTDELPKGADCMMLVHFCTIWSESANQTLFKKCFDALSPGGSLIIFNQMQNDTRDGPLLFAAGSVYFLTLATGVGMIYTWSEYIDWLTRAGFSEIKKYRFPNLHGAIIATKPIGLL